MIFVQVSRWCLLFLSVFLPGTLQSIRAAQQNADSLQVHLGNGYEALKQEQYETAEKEFRAALALDASLAMRARFPLAIALFEQHKFAESRQELESVRQATGDQTGISYYLGRLDLEERKYSSAVENLVKASVRPPFPDTAFYLGLAYLKQGSNAEAENWLNKAMEANPDDSRAEYQLATLYKKEGRQEEADRIFQQAKEAKERSDKQSQLKFDCGQALDRGPTESATELCDQLYDPNDANKLTTLGVLYGQHGQLEKALKPLRRAAELAPQSPQMQYNLAFTYFRLNRFEDARATLVEAVQQWPDLFSLNALYGAVLWNLHQAQPAYAALHHARELNLQDPSTSALLYQATMALAERAESTGDSADALKYLQEAATLSPKAPEPHQHMAAIYSHSGNSARAKEEQRKSEELAKLTKD
jgi:Flp pilus assembly protein TadD